ncbi:MAG: Uma2 family endonuclease [Polyangiaceae bacterium]
MSEPRRPATYDDLRALPANVVGEIVGGRLLVNPRPGSSHARASSRLGAALDGPFDRGKGGPGGWVLLDEPELHLHGDVLVPDLAGWRRERMPHLPDAAAFEIPPDWVCEVLSPSTTAVDRTEKLPIYAREGVAHVWLIDPAERILEVFRLERGFWTLQMAASGERGVRAEPFDAVELELGALWER